MTTDDAFEQRSLFEDPNVQAEETELFGDAIRPKRVRLDVEGDYWHGWLRDIQRNVDLKTGYAPVDIYIIEAISGVLAGGTERMHKGRSYAYAALHATAKNRLSEANPQIGERVAMRRDRDFVSNVEGPSFGKILVAYTVRMPDRPDPDGEGPAQATKPEPVRRSRKAA